MTYKVGKIVRVDTNIYEGTLLKDNEEVATFRRLKNFEMVSFQGRKQQEEYHQSGCNLKALIVQYLREKTFQ